MARRERVLDPEAGPAARFAHTLRELRRQAGTPTYREMQTRSFVSYSTLSRAASGRGMPSWTTTEAYVLACDADPAQWRPRWEQASREEAARQAAVVASPPLVQRPAEPRHAPRPEDVYTVAELRAAVAELGRNHDVRIVSSTMRAPLSLVRLVRGWPEQVEPRVFLGYVRACGVAPAGLRAWSQAWRAAAVDRRRQHTPFPTPGHVHKPEEMRAAIEAMIRLTSVEEVAGRLGATAATVGRVLRGAEYVDAELFGRFVVACGAPSDEVEAWVEARRRVIETRERRRLVAVTGPSTPRLDVMDRPGTTPMVRSGIDPSTATTYEELLDLIRRLQLRAGVSSDDIERATAGRLSSSTANGILAGVVSASGEQLILLLRACGLRQEIDGWVSTWSRLRGAQLGNPLPSRRRPASSMQTTLRRMTSAARHLAAPGA